MSIIDVAAAIIFLDNKILLSQRQANSPYAGKWEFPGGKLEQGENFVEALQRELFEELDLKIALDDLKFFYHRKFVAENDLIINIKFYICNLSQDLAKSKEQQIIKYFSINDLRLIEFPPADIEVVNKLIQKFT